MMDFDRRKGILVFDIAYALDAIGVDEVLEYFGEDAFIERIDKAKIKEKLDLVEREP